MDSSQPSNVPRAEFGLFLFDMDPATVQAATEADVTGVIVDWEIWGKHRRQAGYDTQINVGTRDDLRRVRKTFAKTIICRINSFGGKTKAEVEAAITDGADEILLPMVSSVENVEAVLSQASGRCGVGIMVERQATIDILETLARLPLSRAYVGLNDLCIDRGHPHLFVPLVDGAIEECRAKLADIPVGFGGLTLPHLGTPIPCRLLMSEMLRLNCAFSILRRSFLADTAGQNFTEAVAVLREALKTGALRTPQQIECDLANLRSAIAALPCGAAYPL